MKFLVGFSEPSSRPLLLWRDVQIFAVQVSSGGHSSINLLCCKTNSISTVPQLMSLCTYNLGFIEHFMNMSFSSCFFVHFIYIYTELQLTSHKKTHPPHLPPPPTPHSLTNSIVQFSTIHRGNFHH